MRPAIPTIDGPSGNHHPLTGGPTPTGSQPEILSATRVLTSGTRP